MTDVLRRDRGRVRQYIHKKVIRKIGDTWQNTQQNGVKLMRQGEEA